jgi:hypothetical protein
MWKIILKNKKYILFSYIFLKNIFKKESLSNFEILSKLNEYSPN